MDNYHPLIGSTNSGGGNWNIFANTEWDDFKDSSINKTIALSSSVQESYFYGLNIRNISMRYSRQNYRRLSGTTEGTATALYRMTESQMDRLTSKGAVPLPVSYFDMVTTTPGLGSYINEWAISTGISSGPLLSGKHSFMASMFAGIGGAIDSSFGFNKQTNTDPYFQDSYRVNQTDAYKMQKDGPTATVLGNIYQFAESATYSVISYLAIAYPLATVSDKIITNFTEGLLTKSIQNKDGFSAVIRKISGISKEYDKLDPTDIDFYKKLKAGIESSDIDPYYFHNQVVRKSASDMWSGTLDLITYIASPFKVGSEGHRSMQQAGQAVGEELASVTKLVLDDRTKTIALENTGFTRARRLAKKLDNFLEYIPLNPLLWSWGGINPNQATIHDGFTSLKDAISLSGALDIWKKFYDDGRIQDAKAEASRGLAKPVTYSFKLAYVLSKNFIKELFSDFHQQVVSDEFYKHPIIKKEDIENKSEELKVEYTKNNPNSPLPPDEQFQNEAKNELELIADNKLAIGKINFRSFFTKSANYLYGRTKQLMNSPAKTLQVNNQGHLIINLIDKDGNINEEKLEEFKTYIEEISPVQKRIERQINKRQSAVLAQKNQYIEYESANISAQNNKNIWSSKLGKFIVLGGIASFLVSRAASDLFSVNIHASQLTQMLESATGRKEYHNLLTQGQNVDIEANNIVDLSDILLIGQSTGVFGQGIGIGSHSGESKKEYEQRYSDTVLKLHTIQSIAGIGVTLAAGYVAGRRAGRGDLEITVNLGEETSEAYKGIKSLLDKSGMALEGNTIRIAGGRKLGLNLKYAGLAAIGVSWLIPNAINYTFSRLRSTSRFVKGLFGLGPSSSTRKYLNMNADASSYLEGYFSNIKAQVMMGKSPSKSSLESALMARLVSKSLDIYNRPDEQVINTAEGNIVTPVQTAGNLAFQSQMPILTPQTDVENIKQAGNKTGQYFISEGFRGPMLLGYNMTVGSPIGFDLAHPEQGALGLGIIYSPQSNNYLNYMADLTQVLTTIDTSVSAFAALSIIFRLPSQEYSILQKVNNATRVLFELPTFVLIGGLKMTTIPAKSLIKAMVGLIDKFNPNKLNNIKDDELANQSVIDRASINLIKKLPSWLKTSAALETGAIAAWSILSTDERFGFATGMHLDTVNINDPKQAAPDTYTWYLRGTTFIASVLTWYIAGNFKSMSEFEDRYRLASDRIGFLENKIEETRKIKNDVSSAAPSTVWQKFKKRVEPIYDELKLFYWKNTLANLSFAGKRVEEVNAEAVSSNLNASRAEIKESENLKRPIFSKLKYFTEISGQQQKIFRFFKTQIIISTAVAAIAYSFNQGHAGNIEEFYHKVREGISAILPGSRGKKTLGDLVVDTYKLNNWFSSDNNGYTGITSASVDIKNGSIVYEKLQYKSGSDYRNINSSQLVQSAPTVAKNFDSTTSNLKKINGEIQVARAHKKDNLADILSDINSISARAPYIPIPLVGGIKITSSEIPNSHNSFYIQFQSPGIDLSMSEYSTDSKFFFEQAAQGRDDIENMLREIRQNSNGDQDSLGTYIKYITASLPTRNRARAVQIPLSRETKNLINQSSISRSASMDKLARLQVLSYQTPRQMAANRLRRQLEKLNYEQILQIIKNTSNKDSEKNGDPNLYNSNLEMNMNRISINNAVDFYMNHNTNENVANFLSKFSQGSVNTDVMDDNENIYKSAELNSSDQPNWLSNLGGKLGNATDIITGLPVIGYYAGLAIKATLAITGIYGIFATFGLFKHLNSYTAATQIHSKLSFYYREPNTIPEMTVGFTKVIADEKISVNKLKWTIRADGKYYEISGGSTTLNIGDKKIIDRLNTFNEQLKGASQEINTLKKQFAKDKIGIFNNQGAIKNNRFKADSVFDIDSDDKVQGIKEFKIKAVRSSNDSINPNALWIEKDQNGNDVQYYITTDGNVAPETDSATIHRSRRGFNIHLENSLMDPYEKLLDTLADKLFKDNEETVHSLLYGDGKRNDSGELIDNGKENFKTIWKDKIRNEVKKVLEKEFPKLKILNLDTENIDGLVDDILKGKIFDGIKSSKKGIEGVNEVYSTVQELVYSEIGEKILKEFENSGGLTGDINSLVVTNKKAKNWLLNIFGNKKSLTPENAKPRKEIISSSIGDSNAANNLNPSKPAELIKSDSNNNLNPVVEKAIISEQDLNEIAKLSAHNLNPFRKLIHSAKAGNVIKYDFSSLGKTAKSIGKSGIGAVGGAVTASMHIVAAGIEGGRFINLPATSNNLHERMVDPNYSADEAKLAAREYVMGLGQGAADTVVFALIEGSLHINKALGYALMAIPVVNTAYDAVKGWLFPNSNLESALPEYITSAGTTIANAITKFTIGATGLLGDAYVDTFRPRKDWDPVRRTLMPAIGNFTVGVASGVVEWFGLMGLVWGIYPPLVAELAAPLAIGVAGFNLINWLGSSLIPSIWASWGRGIRRFLQDHLPVIGNLFIGEGETGEYAQILSNQYYFNRSLERPISTDSIRTAEQKALLGLRYLPNDITGETTLEYFASGIVNSKTVYLEDPRRSRFVDNNEFLSRTFEPIPLIDSIGSAVLRNRAFKLHQVIAQDEWKKAASNASDRAKLETIQKYKDNYYKTYKSKFNPTTSAKVAHAKHIANAALQNGTVTATQEKKAVATNPSNPPYVPQTPSSKGCSNLRPSTKTNLCINATSKQVTIEKIASIDFNTAHSIPNYNPQQNIRAGYTVGPASWQPDPIHPDANFISVT